MYLSFSFPKYFLIGLLLTSSVAFGSTPLKFITLEVAPWAHYSADQKEIIGLFPELVDEIQSLTGYDISISLSSHGFARINRELETGRQDCTMTIQDPRRNSYIKVGESIVSLDLGVIAQKEKELKKYQDLYDISISVHQVFAATENFLTDPRVRKQYDESYEVGLKKIEHGRLDAIAGPVSKIYFLARSLGIRGLLGTPMLLKKEPIYFQCSKNSSSYKYFDELNMAIKKLKAKPIYKQIINKYHYSTP